ncbi:MAG: YabP/YqfC family sporulation protein [Pygmaiobacter massiliensis]|nr:YabP/YqfC family sporulation protein [Pygmaiobacter massiliensis]
MARKEKESLAAILRHSFTPPGQALYQGACVQISDQGAVQIENCKGIADYNENYVEAKLSGCSVRISGDDLVLLTLSKGNITVEGRVFSVEFFYQDQ